MATVEKTIITVETTVNAPVAKVWECWTSPEHVTQWNNASDDWHTPHAENDLRVGGKFLSRMEAKDGSFGFDFIGLYEEVEENKSIVYTMEDGRKVAIAFISEGGSTEVTESFEAEATNSIELQQAGWQAILNNFKKYVESSL
ncbi:SRPBCC family protein [Emticicia sp. SJ17W-69]|uniref:SRPBCC family protein n=1 Tax=Emticicia sp. SJ17W-69 TaxID=3421657 RepID=UPI003EB9C29F